jgi:hypothetical protein
MIVGKKEIDSATRSVLAAWLSARSYRPAEAGRSGRGSFDGRKASAFSIAPGSSAASRLRAVLSPVQESATALRQPTSASSASARRRS